MADPKKAREQAAVRAAVLEGVLELTAPMVVEPIQPQLAPALAIVRRALAAWSAEPGFRADVAAVLEAVLAADATRPLGDLLGELRLRDVLARRAEEAVRARLGALVASEGFAAWLGALVG
jgi:hypothetical protein